MPLSSNYLYRFSLRSPAHLLPTQPTKGLRYCCREDLKSLRKELLPLATPSSRSSRVQSMRSNCGRFASTGGAVSTGMNCE
mmetsp:Transcript_112204/g.198758  ORF Transcript_112204/g.198758 Transcript_112204/m.198758 type:complete len:81 (-) Transcript_112204:934-1176(-)